MTAGPAPRRKVLIVEDDTSIRNVIYVLLASMGYDGAIARSQEAFVMLKRESFGAVLLDLRCAYAPPEEVISKIREVRPSLIGRVLVITGEVADAQTMQMLEHHCLAHISRRRLAQELGDCLRKILAIARPAPHAIS